MKTILLIALLLLSPSLSQAQVTYRDYIVQQPPIVIPQPARTFREYTVTSQYTVETTPQAYYTPLPTIVYAPVRYYVPTTYYAPALASYGAYLGNGRYATPSGRPVGPGILPGNGPIRGLLRSAAGFDPVR